MKRNRLRVSALLVLLPLLALPGVTHATLIIHGMDPVMDNGGADGWSGIAVFTTPIEPPPGAPTDGTVVRWNYAVDAGRSTGGHVTPLLMENDGGVYSIIGIGETRDPPRDSVYQEDFELVDGTDRFDTATGNTYHMAVLQQRDGGDDANGGVIPFGNGGAGMFYFNTVGPDHEPKVGDIATAGHSSGPGGRFYAINFEVEFGKSADTFRMDVNYLAETNELEIKWDSESGRVYNLRSETDPSAAEPIDWPIFDGHSDIEATPPENTLVIPRPDDETRFLVVESFPAPPMSIFSDDFESGLGDWTVGSDGAAGTMWELGTPSTVGPPAANSPDNCFGTNLASDYGEDADVWLRSPAIDLTTAGGATLSYFEYRDIEEGFDAARLTVLDASDNSELAVIEDTIDGTTNGWEQESKAIPEAALGKTIKIEFRFGSDDISNFAGWYIDDFEVTVP